MTRRFECVLFDFGGVFTTSPFAANAAVAEELGVGSDRIADLVFGPYDRDTDHPWHRLERGEISLAATREAIIANARAEGLELDPIQVLIRASGDGVIHHVVVDRVRALREQGYQTAMVTNNAHEFRDHWRPMIPLDELFDVVVDSSEVGVRKPSPEIFHIALRALGNRGAEGCVFLDDYPGNVVAAESIGMRGVLVEPDPEIGLQRLDEILAAG